MNNSNTDNIPTESDPSIYNTIDQLLVEGITYKKISQETGVSYRKIRRRYLELRSEGVDLPERKAGRRTKTVDYTTIDEQLQNPELTFTQISKQANISYTTLRRRINELKESGVELPERYRRRKNVDYTTIDEHLQNPELKLTQISQQTGVSLNIIRRRINELKESGIELPVRNKRINTIDYSTIDELLQNPELTLTQISEQTEESYRTLRTRLIQLESEGVELPENRRIKRKAFDYTNIDIHLQNPELTYSEISEETGENYDRIRSRALDLIAEGVDLPERRRGRKRGSNNSSLILRNEEIVKCALSMFDSYQEIGRAYNLSRESIRKIIIDEGINNYADQRTEHNRQVKNKLRLMEERRNLLNLLKIREAFLELKEERGENYALAWRLKEIYGWGRNYSTEEIETLIRLRREGNGYKKCTRLAGLDPKYTIHIYKILQKALHDVPLDFENQFQQQKYFTTSEEESKLEELAKEDISLGKIARIFGVQVATISYHLNRLNITRDCDKSKKRKKNRSHTELSRIDELIQDQQLSYREISEQTNSSIQYLTNRANYLRTEGIEIPDRRRRRIDYSIIDTLLKNPELTLKEISKESGHSIYYIRKRIKELKESGVEIQERIGRRRITQTS